MSDNDEMSPIATMVGVISILTAIIWMGSLIGLFTYILENKPFNYYFQYIIYRTIFMFVLTLIPLIRYQYIKIAKQNQIKINYWFESKDGDEESFWWFMTIINPEMLLPIALIYYLINKIVSIIIYYKKDPYFNDNIIDDE